MKELIQKLVGIAGPSGHEGRVCEAIMAEVKPYASSIEVDSMGSLLVTVGKKKANGKRVMISAHMDEIGVIVTHVDRHGFARFTNLGGVFPRNCMSAHVTFLNGTRGVINGDRLEEPGKAYKLDQLFIDVGANSPEDCPVKIGDVGIFERPVIDLGKRLVSKAMDDRVGCAVAIETIRRIKNTPNELVFTFSTQEEVSLRGATTAAYKIDPDIGIAVDVTSVGDVPTGKMEVALGKGPAIKVKDTGMISDPRVVDWMTKSAKKLGLPHQLEVLEGGTTDARAIQLTRAGVPTGCISIPTRYIHSPAEMIDLDDVTHSVELLVELLENPIEIQ